MTVIKKSNSTKSKVREDVVPKRKNFSSKKSQVKKETEPIIILKDISFSDILLSHYGEQYTSDKLEDEENQETMVYFEKLDIGITDLLHEKSKKSKRNIMFLDPHKDQVKLWGIMIDLTASGPLPRYTQKPCWWCRNKFSYHPIGCPIRYNGQKINGVSKDRVDANFLELNLTLDYGTDFFETEGIFCTFPCIKAYILDQLSRTTSPKYKKSLTLLTLLYLKLVGVICTIPTAGSWKLTTDWGGHMSPPEYRSTTGLLEYTETVNIRRPYMFCSSNWIREKRIKQ